MPLSSGLGSSAASAVAAVFGGQPPCRQPPFRARAPALHPGGGESGLRQRARGQRGPVPARGVRADPQLRSAGRHAASRPPRASPAPSRIRTPRCAPRTRAPSSRRRSGSRTPCASGATSRPSSPPCSAATSQLLGRSLQDVVAEPARSLLIPGFPSVKAAALAAGRAGLLHLGVRARRSSRCAPRANRPARAATAWRRRSARRASPATCTSRRSTRAGPYAPWTRRAGPREAGS